MVNCANHFRSIGTVASLQCPNWVATALWYNIILTGTNTQGQPIQNWQSSLVATESPETPERAVAGDAGRVASQPCPSASKASSGPVPFQTVGNHVLVSALLNQKEHATLLVDTGASHTFLTPDTAKRLGVSPAADAPKHTTTVIGGRQVEFPLVLLSNLADGPAIRESVHVGCQGPSRMPPWLMGFWADFLKDFTMTLDYATSRLQLCPQRALPTRLLPPH